MNRFTIPTLALATLLCSQSEARRIETWSFHRLNDTADFILIGTMASTEQWPEKLSTQPFAEQLEGQLTTFDVATIFKGKEIGKQIQVVHYKVQKGLKIANGPDLASFDKAGRRLNIKSVNGRKVNATLVEGMPHYLLFLKRRDDGKYEPISGQIDSALSVHNLSESTGWLDAP